MIDTEAGRGGRSRRWRYWSKGAKFQLAKRAKAEWFIAQFGDYSK